MEGGEKKFYRTAIVFYLRNDILYLKESFLKVKENFLKAEDERMFREIICRKWRMADG